MKPSSLVLIAVLIAAPVVGAESGHEREAEHEAESDNEHDDEHEAEHDLGAHEHGAATLDVVIDGATVYLEFGSPWVNLVGFEHEPSSESEHTAIADAEQQLSEAETLFVAEGGDCSASSEAVESERDGNHSEVQASYRLECTDIDALTAIDVALMEIWPDIDSLTVQLAGPSGQHQSVLSAEDSSLDLEPVN